DRGSWAGTPPRIAAAFRRAAGRPARGSRGPGPCARHRAGAGTGDLRASAPGSGMSGPYTLPNLLTGLRIALIPVIIALFYMPYHWSDMASGLLFAVVGITDA